MSSEPLVRVADERDFERIAEMTNKHFPHMRVTPSKISERVSRSFLYLVAVVDGVAVGFVDVKIMGGRAKVMGLAVEEEFRGRGIGSALLSKAIEVAKQRGCNLVYLKVKRSNARAVRLYERHGFVFRKEVERNGESVYVMSRKFET